MNWYLADRYQYHVPHDQLNIYSGWSFLVQCGCEDFDYKYY